MSHRNKIGLGYNRQLLVRHKDRTKGWMNILIAYLNFIDSLVIDLEFELDSINFLDLFAIVDQIVVLVLSYTSLFFQAYAVIPLRQSDLLVIIVINLVDLVDERLPDSDFEKREGVLPILANVVWVLDHPTHHKLAGV